MYEAAQARLNESIIEKAKALQDAVDTTGKASDLAKQGASSART